MKIVQVRKNAFLSLGALVSVMVVMSGCLKQSETTVSTPKTYISLMHLAPRSTAVETYFNNEKASSSITYGMVSSNYSALDPNIYGITFKKTGGDSLVASLSSAIYDSLKYYTIVLYNYDSTKVAAARIVDDYSELGLAPDKAFYRFFHMSADVGPVDLYFDNTLIESYRSYTDNLGGSSYNRFTGVTPSTHNIILKKAGTSEVIATAYNVYLSGQQAYTLFLKGIPGGTGTNALILDYLIAAD